MNELVLALLIYSGWTLSLAILLISLRSVDVLRGKKQAHEFGPYEYDSTFLAHRIARAYQNSLEGLSLFIAVILAGYILGQFSLLGSVVFWLVAARIAQSVTHIVAVSHWMVQIRFVFFLIQLGILGWIVVKLLTLVV